MSSDISTNSFIWKLLQHGDCSMFLTESIILVYHRIVAPLLVVLYFAIQLADSMAGTTTNISIRMDSDLKAQADALFAELGMNLSTAFNIFVRQSLREGGIPFTITLNQPNKETISAMLEAERIAKDPSVKGYTDLDELFADLKK